GFFSSGVQPADGYFSRVFTAAGGYTITDEGSPNTSAVHATTIVSPLSGSTSSSFTVTWASASADANQVYDVQLKTGTQWTDWQTGVTGPSAVFNSSSPGWVGAGTYHFRARLRSTATGASTGYSPASSSLVVS